MTKIKSPLKHTGGNEGHVLMTKQAHIDAHGGDAVAAGYEEETEEKSTSYKGYKLPTKENTDDSEKENKKEEETDFGLENQIIDKQAEIDNLVNSEKGASKEEIDNLYFEKDKLQFEQNYGVKAPDDWEPWKLQEEEEKINVISDWKKEHKKNKDTEGYAPVIKIYNNGSQEYEDAEVEVDDNGNHIIPKEWNENFGLHGLGTWEVNDDVAKAIRLKEEKKKSKEVKEELKLYEKEKKNNSDRNYSYFENNFGEDYNDEQKELIKKFIYDYDFNDGKDGRAGAFTSSKIEIDNVLALAEEREGLFEQIEAIDPKFAERYRSVLGVSQASVDQLKRELENIKSKKDKKDKEFERAQNLMLTDDVSEQEYNNLSKHNNYYNPIDHGMAISLGEGMFAWEQEGVDPTRPEIVKLREEWEDPNWEQHKEILNKNEEKRKTKLLPYESYTDEDNEIEVSYDNRMSSGTVDFETFMQLTEEIPDESDMEKFVSERLQNYHDNFNEKVNSDSKLSAQNAKGQFYYEFDYKNLDGDDELIITRRGAAGTRYSGDIFDYGFGDGGEITIPMPTDWANTKDGMWSDVYAQYASFMNQETPDFTKKDSDEILNTVAEGWTSYAGDVTEDALEYGDKFVDENGRVDITAYIEHIGTNTEDIYLEGNILLDFEKRPYIAAGDRRGSIQMGTNTHRRRRPGGHGGFYEDIPVFELTSDHPDYVGRGKEGTRVLRVGNVDSAKYLNDDGTYTYNGETYDYIEDNHTPVGSSADDPIGTFTKKVAGVTHTYRYDKTSGFDPEEHMDEWLKMNTLHNDWKRKEGILEDVLDSEYNRLYEEGMNTTTVTLNGKEYNIVTGGGEIAAASEATEYKTESEYDDYLAELEEKEAALPENIELKKDDILYTDIIEYNQKKETEWFNNKVLPDMEKKWKEKEIKLEEDYILEYNEKLKPHIETIKTTLSTEFKDELTELETEAEAVNNRFAKEDELEGSKIASEIEKELLEEIENGTFDPQSDQDFKDEWRRRADEKYSQWTNSQLKNRQKELDGVYEEFNKSYSQRFMEEEDKILGDWKAGKLKEFEKISIDFQNDFVEKAYETKKGRVQLIPEATYKEIFTGLTKNEEFKFHTLGWKGQVASINLAWAAQEQIYDNQGMSKEDVDARREEFYYKAYSHISLDKKGRPTNTAMKMWSDEVIDMLDNEEDLTPAQEEQLYYAKSIMKDPEFMKSTKVGQFFDGMGDAFSKGEWMPLIADYQKGRHQGYVNDLLKKEKLHTDDPENNPELTVD